MKTVAQISLIDPSGLPIENPLFDAVDNNPKLLIKLFDMGFHTIYDINEKKNGITVALHLANILTGWDPNTEIYKKNMNILQWYLEMGKNLILPELDTDPEYQKCLQRVLNIISVQQTFPHTKLIVNYLGKDRVKTLIEKHNVIHSLSGAYSYTADNNRNSIKYYINEVGVDPNVRHTEKDGMTPIMCTTNKEIHDLLVSLGADINKTDNNGKPLLKYLLDKTSNSDNEVIQSLIKQLAKDYNKKSKNKPIQQNGDLFPQELSASVNSKNEVKELIIDSMFSSIINKRTSMFKELIKNFKNDINAKNENDETFLHIATKNDDLSLINSLIKKGVDVNATDKNGFSAAVYLCKPTNYRGKLTKTKRSKIDASWNLFLEHGFDFNRKNQNGDVFVNQIIEATHGYSSYGDYKPIFSTLIPELEQNNLFHPFELNNKNEDFFIKALNNSSTQDSNFHQLLRKYICEEKLETGVITSKYVSNILTLLTSEKIFNNVSFYSSDLTATLTQIQQAYLKHTDFNKPENLADLISLSSAYFYNQSTKFDPAPLKMEIEKKILQFENRANSNKKTIKL